jgi:hypothetical protein
VDYIILIKTMKALYTLLIIFFHLNLSAEATNKFIFQFDNDLFYDIDQDYTNGIRVALMRENENEPFDENALQRSLHQLTGSGSESSLGKFRTRGGGMTRYAWGTGLTQLMYTPKSKSAKVPPYGERPFAGWLGLEFSLHTKNDYSVSSVTLTLGTTGKASFAEKTQNWVHNLSHSHLYKGWDSQVPQEVTVNLHLDHKHKLAIDPLTEDLPLKLDGYYEWGAALGNFQTNAYLGMLLRAGYNLSASYSTPRVQIGSYAHDLFRKEDPRRNRFSFYTYGGLRGTAVLHDISLNGPLFRDFKYKVENQAFVGEALIGYGLSWRHFEISHSFTHRTREFKSQKTKHPFGSILLRFDLPF